MARTKILFLITKSNFGGAQKYVYDLATLLSASEYNTVVAFGGAGELAEKLKEKNIRTVSIPRLARDIHIWNEIAVFSALLALFAREKPDIIHLNSSKIGGLGAFTARLYNLFQSLKPGAYRLKARIIFTAHGWPFREDRPWWQRLLIRFGSWLTIVLSHKVIAVSEHDAREGRTMPFARKKIYCVHNGIRQIQLLSRSEARTEIARGDVTHTIPEDAYWIGTNAELTRNKGLEYAIEAMSFFAKEDIKKPFAYVIISAGELKDALSRKIAELRLGEKVFLVGTKKDAARLLLAFDCFLLPSIKEGLPYVLLEAGLAKLPVVATNVGGIPEIIEDKKTGILIPPKNPRAITNATRSFMEDGNAAVQYGVRLEKMVKEKFTPERMLAETVRIYEEH